MSLLNSSNPVEPPKLYQPYYASNLYAGLQAIRSVAPGAMNTGDWFMEVIYELEEVVADKDVLGPNVSAEEMSSAIVAEVFRGLSPEVLKKTLLEVFSPLELLAFASKDDSEQDKTG